ncbi:tRNA (guanosine(46)-N7)-methyltransferase TrmB [Prochlorococcus marinus]|uniref:tRNA (guanosine(46)-N7)-methyltransferase TrmB n=1 Tax=Prochlorococcus marinus TaxID=1219 RepID=UPI0022B41FBC|nr:tRNA (guanosine(46)-N7)-methyltransferase TrmB [Prochlorococcus marinus]
MRQHVNPLSRFFQLENELPGPVELFENGDLPIHLDIGCARGRFLFDMASFYRGWNYVGLEIRRPLVVAAEKERLELQLRNLKFLFCNANVSLEKWLAKLNVGQLKRVSIQFPDPWYKTRHKKRRLLQPSFLSLLSRHLVAGSELFIQSDVLSIMQEMVQVIDISQNFDSKHNDDQLDMIKNPFKFSTERESYAIKKGLVIYRKSYRRNSNGF